MRPRDSLASPRHTDSSQERPQSVSRRSLLRGAILGGATIAASATGTGPGAPLAGTRLHAAPLPQGASRTLTLVTPRAPSDLDPHSAYDAGSGVALQGPFEGLIHLKPGTTDEYD